LQISSGTELTMIDARGSDIQIRNAERRARSFLPMGALLHQQSGDRPSLPDSRPAIGPVSDIPGLWLNCGHQHIGFNTSAGSARILAAQMRGESVDEHIAAFLPDRLWA
jgi:D-amino-acid dehydrogenase